MTSPFHAAGSRPTGSLGANRPSKCIHLVLKPQFKGPWPLNGLGLEMLRGVFKPNIWGGCLGRGTQLPAETYLASNRLHMMRKQTLPHWPKSSSISLCTSPRSAWLLWRPRCDCHGNCCLLVLGVDSLVFCFWVLSVAFHCVIGTEIALIIRWQPKHSIPSAPLDDSET